jgi:hypothetical protein
VVDEADGSVSFDKDIGETVDDLDEGGKLGREFSLVDELEEIDIRDGVTQLSYPVLHQNQVLIVCMTQDQLFHTYDQNGSPITKCYE